jgi:LuxR family maltose regulon positive regulatory protein
MQARDDLQGRTAARRPSNRRLRTSESSTLRHADHPPTGARALHDEGVSAPGLSTWSPPRFPSGLISRPRLVRRLADERRASTAIICAPPGYGKTTLLAEWTERDKRPSAWIALTEQHRHPAVLLEAIMLALDELEPLDGRVLAKCRSAARERAAEPQPELMAALTATLSSMGAERLPAVLVLDNAHLPRSRAAARVLSTVASAMPACAKLALASRTEPALQRGRLRAEHELLELGPHDLALTAYEAHRLLRAAGLQLDPGAVERLVASTEGWPAALYLAALSLLSQDDADTAVEHFRGADRGITEYVRQELLSPLAKEQRAFLRRSSILDQLSARLCDAVLERTDSASVLETLAFHDLMLLPLDTSNKWYRCHSLVRDVLRAELEARDSESALTLSGRASHWFEECGDIDRAIDHAVAAADIERVGELLWSHSSDLFLRGRDSQVRRWLSGFPAEQIARSPRLALCAAFAHLMAPDLAAAEHWARTAASAIALRPTDDSRALEGGIALVTAAIGRDGVERMGRVASQASALLGDGSPWSSFCCLLRGVADHVSGERPKARTNLEAGVRLSATLTPMVESLCMAQLAMMNAEDGDWERAADRIEVATGLVSSHGLAPSPPATLVFSVSAWIAGRQGRCDEAKRDLTQAIHLLDQSDGFLPWYEVETRILIARAAIQLADVVTARASLSRASRVLRRLSDAPEFHVWLDNGWADIDERSASALSGSASLTIAELRILRFLPTHLSFREIGERLHVSTNTVKTQAHAVYGKLGAGSRSEAIAKASALGLIEAPVV